ncbi:hypothetical protein P152DRAFT_473520 [Eremomyces bilateralis CBS 781.70]|uniref:Homoserine dehydrogenase n=1 Tax=Eremomyces bilateralis CBS 781.70 TaxID=1392243 RepID=A0A6G1G4Z6_9PEZI|nr:uncharacterized protein P152DRAFT_473520 [Eremomyces bilateralis CBS 781.70]KAF1812996.1 hypothetical protein P152DRAFT_473520 [Eremomyces bilateralis CBS 781.70]
MAGAADVILAIIGVGGVGKPFLKQLTKITARLAKSPSNPVFVKVVYLARSQTALYDRDSYKQVDLQYWEQELAARGTSPLSPSEVAEFLTKYPQSGHRIVVDNTSDPTVAAEYPTFIRQGISVVTPNKKAFSGPLALWESIISVAQNGRNESGKGGYIYHESSVGAGLPIINTLTDLLVTGDEVRKIEGVFSGTMSFLFNQFMPVPGAGKGMDFAAAVKIAQQSGFTEPDPRDDLNGMDVARKLVILARISGMKLELEGIPIQSLIPNELESCASGAEFLEKLHEFDSRMDELKASAEKDGKVLRYVGSIDVISGESKVGLQRFDPSHPIGGLKGSDNIINFYTKRYGSKPLTIQGAGAGGDITAMGVSADLLRVIRLTCTR